MRLHKFTIAIAAAAFVSACGHSMSDRLIGTWQAKDARGNPLTMIIASDHTLKLVTGNSIQGAAGELSWQLDQVSEPMRLDIEVHDSGGAIDHRQVMLFKFIEENTLEVRIASPLEKNPKFEGAGDGERQFIFARRQGS